MALRTLSFAALGAAAFGLTHPSGRAVSPADATPATIEVTLTEGTNIAAALSPDGATLAIDLVGRIWTLPASGGTAIPITDPLGDARQPRWSPDGSRIVFQAYWAGDYDVWVVDADGSDLAQLTSGPFDDREPTWSRDGAQVAFSSDRGGSYDIWIVDVDDGEVRRATTTEDNAYHPAFGPDGDGLAYVTDGTSAGLWVSERSGRGRRRVVDLEDDDGFAPTWSLDGQMLAYVRTGFGESGLYVVPASGGEAQRLSEPDEDVFPFRATWTPDDLLVYTGDGRVRSRPVGGGRATDVPFSGTVTLDRPTYRKALRSFDEEGPRPVKGIVSPTLSPSGATVLFSALGDLWSMEIGSEPRRLTDDAFVEVDPSWAPDGRRFAYASDREGSTELYVHEVSTGRERRLTSDGGAMPVWSPDGREIAYVGGQGQSSGVRVLDVASGATRTIRSGLNGPGRPTWSPDGRSVAVSALRTYSSRFREGVNQPLLLPVSRPISEQDAGVTGPVSGWTSLAGDTDEPMPIVLQEGERWLDFPAHTSFASRGTDGPIWSPDGRKMAYVASGVLWLAPITPVGNPAGPARRLNNEMSSDPSWSGDSRSILYLTTDRLRRVWIETGRIEDVPISLTWSRTLPTERYVVHAGELFDGVSSQLRRNVDIVVEGNRIVRVADHDAAYHVERVVDASEGVVSPGLIEIHTHGSLAGGEHVGRQWLSYGVTTIRSPAADPYEMVEAREASAVRRRLQPRLFGTGFTIDGSRIYYGGGPALDAPAQIELAMAQARDLRFDLIKTYVRLSDPMQKRVVAEAHALGIPVTSHELYPAVAFGADGVEHVRGTSRRGYSTKVTALNRSYQDVVALLARSGMTITPTVGIYGSFGVLAEDDPALFEDPRIPVFSPGAAQGARRGGALEVRRQLVTDMASLGRRVVEQGGTVVVGTDGGPNGLTLIAEMQALVDYGGMATIDVMRGTTSASADAMGYGSEIGRVREGMLADMVVFGGDPLRDIRAVRDVRLVIEDGRVHTMEELLRRPD